MSPPPPAMYVFPPPPKGYDTATNAAATSAETNAATSAAPVALPWSSDYTAYVPVTLPYSTVTVVDPALNKVTLQPVKANKFKKVKKIETPPDHPEGSGGPNLTVTIPTSNPVEVDVLVEEEYLESYSVQKTGAVADLRSSVQLLMV